MPAYTAIRSISLITVVLIICEMLTVAVISMLIGKEKFDSLMLNSLQRSYIALPGNVLFAVVVIIAYYLMMKKGEKNRDISSQDR
jgi:hypothetical protein